MMNWVLIVVLWSVPHGYVTEGTFYATWDLCDDARHETADEAVCVKAR